VGADGVNDCLDAGQTLPVPVRYSGTSSRSARRGRRASDP